METETQDPEESLEQVKAALVTSMDSYNKAKVGLTITPGRDALQSTTNCQTDN